MAQREDGAAAKGTRRKRRRVRRHAASLPKSASALRSTLFVVLSTPWRLVCSVACTLLLVGYTVCGSATSSFEGWCRGVGVRYDFLFLPPRGPVPAAAASMLASLVYDDDDRSLPSQSSSSPSSGTMLLLDTMFVVLHMVAAASLLLTVAVVRSTVRPLPTTPKRHLVDAPRWWWWSAAQDMSRAVLFVVHLAAVFMFVSVEITQRLRDYSQCSPVNEARGACGLLYGGEAATEMVATGIVSGPGSLLVGPQSAVFLPALALSVVLCVTAACGLLQDHHSTNDIV